MKRGLVTLAFLAGCGTGVDEFNQASTQQCPPTTVAGVDVYQGDTPIDWPTVQSGGKVFAFTKASQGDYNKQSNFATNWAMLKSLGMVRGAYHYFDATVDGVAQANWFLAQVNAAGGFETGNLPAVLDLECPTSPTQGSSGNYCLDGTQASGGKNGWAPTATIIQEVWDWLDTVETATGKKPIVYTYPSWTGDFGFTDPKLGEYPLWIASPQSNTCATVPAPWTSAVFWQWSSKMYVPGIGSPTKMPPADQDRFMGTLAQLMAFADTTDATDGGADGPPLAEDLGETIDLSIAPSPDPDLSSLADLASSDGPGKPKGHGDSGCGCAVGGASPSSSPSPLPSSGVVIVTAFAFLLALRLRRRRHADCTSG